MRPPPKAVDAAMQRQVLARAAWLLASAADFKETLRHTIGACLPALGDFGFFDVVHGDAVVRTVAAHQAPEIEAILAPTQWVKQERDDMNLCALSTGESALHDDITDGWYRRVAANESHLEVMRQLAFRSMVTVPMRYRGDLVGALTLFMGRSGRHHDLDDLRFAEEVALLAAPVVANARLVEQHRAAEDALRRSEERLRITLEAGKVGIWDWDIVNDRTEWSERVYDLHGVPRNEPAGGLDYFRTHVHPADIDEVEKRLTAALEGGPPYAVEYRLMLPGGGVRWLSTHSHIVRDAAGRPIRMIGGCTDVTERMELLAAERRARGEAERAQKRLGLLARAGEALSRSLDPEETLRTIGEAIVPEIADWCRIDLTDADGVLQRRLAHHADPIRAQEALALARKLRAAETTKGSMSSVMRTGQPSHGHFGLVENDPDLRLFTATFQMGAYCIVPLVARGRTIGAMAVIQAESGRELSADDRALVMELAQRAAMALDNARLFSETQAANSAKDEFLAMLGHELRNPLAPIASALELMARRGPGAHVEERRIIGRQVTHLSRLIDDLLDVSRIARGKVQLVREPVEVARIVANAVELTRPAFDRHARGVELRMADRAAVVIGDPVRLTQVLCNLLNNAAKFTPADGRVELSVDRVGDRVRIAVEDTGSGIDAALVPHVFELFVQGRQSIDRQAGGLGLGLAIVRSIVEAHGGTVHAHSDGAGHGARFTVFLPASGELPAPATAPIVRDTTPCTPARVLIVDDNVDAALTLGELLQMVGYEARAVHSAQEALDVAAKFAPRVLLLDIGLPSIDGCELARRLRAMPGSEQWKLVAVTGYGRENDRVLALDAGFDEHLVKPVDVDRVVGVISRLASA